jgi:hypothetical protein
MSCYRKLHSETRYNRQPPALPGESILAPSPTLTQVAQEGARGGRRLPSGTRCKVTLNRWIRRELGDWLWRLSGGWLNTKYPSSVKLTRRAAVADVIRAAVLQQRYSDLAFCRMTPTKESGISPRGMPPGIEKRGSRRELNPLVTAYGVTGY